MKHFRLCTTLLTLLFLLVPCCAAFAMKQPVGALQKDDFSYKGIYLGETVDLATLEGLDDELLFDSDIKYMNMDLKQYTYDKGVEIIVEKDTGKVLEIAVRNKKHVFRDRVTYGALAYSLIKAYGYGKRQLVAGQECNIYRSPEFPNMRLVIELDGEHYYLTGVRMTMLALDGKELFDKYGWMNNKMETWEEVNKDKFSFLH